MTATEMLAELRARGVVLRAEGDRLVGDAPRGIITSELLDEMSAHKYALLDVLRREQAELTWRVEAMRAEVQVGRPLPFLCARPAPVRTGSCLSCGDGLPDSHGVRCPLCREAAWRVVRELHPEVAAP